MMDREIKFRGKRETSGHPWAYGYYWHICGHYIKGKDGVDYPVDYRTIGQYTGLKDKNGVEIYEGDIIRQDFEEYTGTIGYVYFEKGAFKITNLYDDDGYNELSAWAEHTVNGKQRIDVIGNIYDNSELLEGEE